jgi:hypothetical protein
MMPENKDSLCRSMLMQKDPTISKRFIPRLGSFSSSEFRPNQCAIIIPADNFMPSKTRYDFMKDALEYCGA